MTCTPWFLNEYDVASARHICLCVHIAAQKKGAKKKRFVYQSFAKRVAALDINVFKRVGKSRAEPLSGSETFFQVICMQR